MIGVATPPVGMCLFVVSGATGIKLERLMREVIPWVIPLIVVLFLITYIPAWCWWCPTGSCRPNDGYVTRGIDDGRGWQPKSVPGYDGESMRWKAVSKKYLTEGIPETA